MYINVYINIYVQLYILCVCLTYLSQNSPPLFSRTELAPTSSQFLFVMDTRFFIVRI